MLIIKHVFELFCQIFKKINNSYFNINFNEDNLQYIEKCKYGFELNAVNFEFAYKYAVLAFVRK